ncbi:hypothetical protein EWH99_07175 [Sporolactobacillus sp. THM7-7]|nr:hypothetical protein EWH99_07175 [Sporolactobacillus sp. THM7-7]
MIALILAILFWLVGMCLMLSSYLTNRMLRTTGEHLLRQAEGEKGKDNEESILLSIEGKVLDNIPSYLVHILSNISGSLLIVLGFVALAFYLR